jgi:signal transduction histidine kinase
MEKEQSNIIENYENLCRLKERIAELERANAELNQALKIREQTEDYLRDEDLLKLVFLRTPTGLALLSGDDLVYQLVNRAYLALTPNPELDPVGRRYEEVWPTIPGFQMPALLRSVLITGETIHSERHRRQYPNGAIRYFSLHLYPIQWKEKPGVLIILWETSVIEYAKLTTEKAAEVAQKRADELSKARQELAEYAARLERSNQDLEAFAYAASHDLQEPLRKIKSFGEILAERMDENLNLEERSFLKRINEAAIRMSSMIEALLTYSRVATQAQPHTDVDLEEVVRGVISDLEIRLNRSEGKVEVSGLPLVEAEPAQMRQLMQNLIGNALKFHRPDVPPVVKVTGRTFFKSPDGEDPFVEIKVIDNGIGFDNIHSEKIFLPFQRLHTRRQYEGSGIGLAICRKIVERHGGKLEAEGIPAEGSTFTIILPKKQKTGLL